jgi:predicted methyltransferase
VIGRRRGLFLLALVWACSPSATPDPPASPDTSVDAVRDETSVRPGINDRFLSEGLDVDAFTEIFEGESREIYRARREIIAELGLEPGSTMADVGAGTGLFLPLFDAAVGARGRVYAVDIAPNFLAHLRERAKREELSSVTVVEATEHSVELPPASVDLAFVCDTYHHFEYPRSSLASLREAIRPGGMLVVIDFERIPDQTRPWVLEHVRAGKDVVTREIEAAGFQLEEEVEIAGLTENYMLRFRRL